MSGATDTDAPTSTADSDQVLDRQNSSNKTAIVPTDVALLAALAPLRTAHPAMGATKLHAKLLQFHPEWVGGVSEKRTRRVLGGAGLAAQAQGVHYGSKKAKGNAEAANGNKHPTSRMLEKFDVSRWCGKVAVRDFGPERGKGLVATKEIAEGEVLWKEDPWVIAPEWEIYDLIQASVACAYCSTPFNSRRTNLAPVACPSASASSSSRHDSADPPPLLLHPCSARFCNRLCLQRATGSTLSKSTTSAVGPHTLICPSLNPASVPFARFARERQWMGIKAWAGCVIKVLLANEREGAKKGGATAHEGIGMKDETVKDVMEFLDALAIMDPEERARVPGLEQSMAANTLRSAHQLFLNALREPAVPYEKKKLARILRTPLPEDLARGLFSYDTFVRGVIKMGLNIEAHGGLYILHSHLNHHCNPNLSARHIDSTTCLTRVTLVARRKIQPDEELSVTYVNPEAGVKLRKAELRSWGIECACEKCVEDEALLEKMEKEGSADGSGPAAEEGFPGLEKELKEGLGLL